MNNTLTNGLSLLMTLANSGQAHGVTELARLTGFPKSHVHRLLSTLVEAQYLEKNAQSRYRIGVGALRLGRELLRNIPIRRLVLPEMMQLVRANNINLTLAMPFGQQAIVIAFVSHDGSSRSPMVSLGSELSPHASASGKLFLAHKEPKQIAEVLLTLGYEQTGPNTHLDSKSLLADLKQIPKRGYSLNNRETDRKSLSFACPIFDQSGRIYAALGISGMADEFSEPRIQELVKVLQDTIDRIHQKIKKDNIL